jgi:type IV secretion system T-DNA border endonuclease VirD2
LSLPSLNPLRVPQLGLALEGPVRPKRGRPQAIRTYAGKLARMAKKAPEVVVKVSGSGKSRAHSLAHLTYITRNGKLQAENERGEKIEGLEAVKEVFKEWGFQTPGDSERRRAQTVNIVLSMPKGTEARAVLEAARGFAKDAFGDNHQYLLALHDDTDHPHVHLAVKAQGFDLTWLKRTKADLQDWRDSFAEKLRDQGVEAEATPRRARGVVQKPQTQAIRHLVQEKRSRVLKAKVDEAIRDLTAPEKAMPRPWEVAIRDRQREVRKAYVEVANDLAKARDETSRSAASQLQAFLKSLPPLETERHRLRRELVPLLEGQGRPTEQHRSKSTPAPERDPPRDRER